MESSRAIKHSRTHRGAHTDTRRLPPLFRMTFVASVCKSVVIAVCLYFIVGFWIHVVHILPSPTVNRVAPTPDSDENHAHSATEEKLILDSSDILEILDTIVEQTEMRASVDRSLMSKPPETSEIFVDKVLRYCVAQRHELVDGEVWIDPSKDFYEEAIREAVLLHPPQRYASFVKMFESLKKSPTFGYAMQLQQDQDYVRRICKNLYSEMDNDPISWGALSQDGLSNQVSVNNDNNITITNDDSNTTVVYSFE